MRLTRGAISSLRKRLTTRSEMWQTAPSAPAVVIPAYYSWHYEQPLYKQTFWVIASTIYKQQIPMINPISCFVTSPVRSSLDWQTLTLRGSLSGSDEHTMPTCHVGDLRQPQDRGSRSLSESSAPTYGFNGHDQECLVCMAALMPPFHRPTPSGQRL